MMENNAIPATQENSPATEPQENEDVQRAKAMLRAALEVLAEKPPPTSSTFGKVIDYINDRWVFFAFIATVVIVLATSLVRDDFSLSYLFDEVAFKQKELEFKEDEARQKENRFNFDKEKFERERAREEFLREQARERVAFAQSLLDVGRYASAARIFEEAVKLDSTNLDARRGLLNARIYEQVRKIPGKGVEYDPVVVQRRIHSLLKRNPDDPFAHIARANMLLESDVDEAERELKLALRIRPNMARAHRLLAEIHLIRNDLDNALAEMQEAIKRSPWDVRYLEAMALIYEERGEFETAVAYFKKANQLDPDYLSVLFETANAYLRRGHIQGAAKMQAQVIAILENPSVAALPKNTDAYEFSAGTSSVWLISVAEKRHYAYQNMALLAFTLQAVKIEGYGSPEPYLEALHRLDLADRAHLKRLLHHHVDQIQARSKKAEPLLEDIRNRILEAIEAGETDAHARKKHIKNVEDKK